jgi:hypothetical protein
MKQNKKLALVFGAGLILYGGRMNTNEFRYYGLIGGDLQIKAYIYMACKIISPDTIDEASKLLAETVAIETNNGKVKDFSSNYGEGLTQFDKATFENVKKLYSLPKHAYLMDRIKKYLFIDVINFEYSNLRKSPLASIVFARLLYYSFSSPLPKDFIGRWEYYKKNFNSYLGKSTYDQYLKASKMAVYGGQNV